MYSTMMRKIFIAFAILISAAASAQKIQYINTYGYEYERFLARTLMGLPADTFAVPTDLRSVKFVARKGTTTYYWNTTTHIWEASAGGNSGTASSGLTKVGDDFQFGGTVSAPAYVASNRNIMANRKVIVFGNGVEGAAHWQFSDSAYSPFQFLSRDTITQNNLSPAYARPLSGVFARREVVMTDGIYQQNKHYGHSFSQIWNWKDSMAMRTDGGDYGQTFHAETRWKPRGTGPQVARIAQCTGCNLRRQEGVATILANMYIDSDGSNRLKINGTIVGFRSYLVHANNVLDTVNNVVYYSIGNLASGKILKSYVFDASIFYGSNVDSAFGWFDTARVARNLFAGNTLFGPGDSTVTQAKLRVNGSALFNGWSGYWANVAANYTSRSFTDKGYVDSAIAAQVAAVAGITSIGTFGSTPNAKGASISSNALVLQPADGTNPGALTAGTQTIGGEKFFTDIQHFRNLINVKYTSVGSSPASGDGWLFAKPGDKKLYWMDDTGTEYDLTATGAGSVNISGTPANHNWTTWTNSSTVKGVPVTASKIVVTDANGEPSTSTADASKADYLANVTSDIQTQINSNNFSNKKVFWVAPAATTTFSTVGTNGVTSSGTISTPALVSTNLLTSTRRTSLSSGASAGTVARVNNTSLELWRGNAAGLGGFTVIFRFGLNTTVTGNRSFVGLIDNTTPPSNLDLTTNTATARIGMVINVNTGNWQFATNTSGASPTLTDLGANFAVNTTDLLELKMVAAANASSVTYTVTNVSTGNTTSATVSSNLPASTSFLVMLSWITNNAQNSAAILDVAKMYAETNY